MSLPKKRPKPKRALSSSSRRAPRESKKDRTKSLYNRVFGELDRAFWLEVLQRCDGNQTKAAEYAGVSYATVKFRVADMRKEERGVRRVIPLAEDERTVLHAVARTSLMGGEPAPRGADALLRDAVIALVQEELALVKG